jgi:hypothetical protein
LGEVFREIKDLLV